MARFLYAHRPSKHVQRRMVIEACRRLDRLADLTEYEFVGFGAYEYVDFELVRRDLGIVTMDSIEMDAERRERYLFNRPFAGITVHFGPASAILPELLDVPRLRIVWLDYTKGLDHEVLGDVGTCLRKLTPGSILIVTVRAKLRATLDQRKETLEAAVGAERLPADIGNADLAPAKLPGVQRDILAAFAPGELRVREDGGEFMQLFDIRYDDSMPMQTWGGLVTGPALAASIAAAGFGGLEQTSLAGDPPVNATVPPLTIREVLNLNVQLPTEGTLDAADVPEDDLDAYRRLYRWYPPVPAPM